MAGVRGSDVATATQHDRWRRGVVVAYLDEPPFGVAGAGSAEPNGCDVELARHVLMAIGVRDVRFQLATFPELIPGIVEGRWQITTPIFVTAERAERVAFSRPVWSLSDGFLVRRMDEGRFSSYEDIARDPKAILAVVADQVQGDTARAIGVPNERIQVFQDQAQAAEAVREHRADASASTAIGNAAYVRRLGDRALLAVPDTPGEAPRPPAVGAFALTKWAPELLAAIDGVLGTYLGSRGHVGTLAAHGLTGHDLGF